MDKKEIKNSPRIRELERKFIKALRELLGPSAGFQEYGNTTCGDKVIMGKHVTVSWHANAYEKSVPKKTLEKLFELVSEMYDDVLPSRKKKAELGGYSGGPVCWNVTYELSDQEDWG